jgi:transcriptional regulator with XRE-family HTH domain
MQLLSIRAARVNLGLTRKEAAKIFEIHHETLANYESDSTKVPRSFFVKIESIYGIPLEYIYFGKEEEHHRNLRNKLNKQHA